MKRLFPYIIFVLLYSLNLQYISPIIAQSSELDCRDGIDNDGDGFVDSYDNDCPCIDTVFNAGCNSILKCEKNTFNIKIDTKWEVNDLINAEFISGAQITFNPNTSQIYTPYVEELRDTVISGLAVINDLGLLEKIIAIDSSRFGQLTHPAFLNHNERTYIFYIDGNSLLICIDENGSLIWRSSEITSFFEIQHAKIADFNFDGIPELYIGNRIFNALTGALLLQGDSSSGCMPFSSFIGCSSTHSIAADVTNHPGLELICGNVIYEPIFVNLNGNVGNSFISIRAPGLTRDGFTTVGDVDGDGNLEIVITRSSAAADGGGLWIWDLEDDRTFYYPPNQVGGGLPTLCDVDNDCDQELIMSYESELIVYDFSANTINVKSKTKIKENSFGVTMSTAFDLNSDGRIEIIYRDSEFLRIYDGETLEVLDSIQVYSGTWLEGPIVSDIDKDGHAEILVSGGLFPDSTEGIFCFESAGEPWAPARQIWNQTGYHVTNVNDDGTIPRQQQNMAAFFDTHDCDHDICPQVYNAFGVQATYRTQKGCPIGNTFDYLSLTTLVNCVSYDIAQDAYTIIYDIINLSDANVAAPAGLPISFYNGDPSTGASLLLTGTLPLSLAPGESLKDQSLVLSRPLSDTLYILVNSDFIGGSLVDILSDSLYTEVECDYSDNLAQIILPPYLQDSINLCEGETYAFIDTTITNEGTYIRTMPKEAVGQSQNECDSLIVELTVTKSDFIRNSERLLGCDSLEITDINGRRQVYFESTIITDTLPSATACDTLNDLEINIFKSIQREIEMEACDSFLWEVNDQVYTETGVYLYNTTTLNGCDSTLVLDLDINESSYVERSIASCDSLQYEGETYFMDTVLVTVLNNAEGCDSTLSINITIEESTMPTTIEWWDCDSVLLESIDGGIVTFYSDTTLINTFEGINGCDSLVVQEITVLPSHLDTIYEVACDTFLWLANGQSYSESGWFTYESTTLAGCDSTLVLGLDILTSTIAEASLSGCDSLTYEGVTYTSSQTLVLESTNVQGCDSTLVLSIDIFSSTDPSIISLSGCDSVEYKGQIYYENETIEENYLSIQGCDSLVIVDLGIYPSKDTTINEVTCDSLVFNGRTLSESGRYTFTLSTLEGCDSTLTLDLTIAGAYFYESTTSCDTFIWDVNGLAYTQSGIYEVMYADINGCDSVYVLDLIFQQEYEQTDTVMACESYFWERSGEWLSVEGSYEYFKEGEALNGIVACDSIFYLELSLEEGYRDTLSIDTTSAYTWNLTGITYTESTFLSLSLPGEDECDSIFVLDLTIRKEALSDFTWPNIISLDSPVNGGFTIYGGSAIQEIRSLLVYDRWGNLIWKGIDMPPNRPDLGWDGYFKGTAVSAGIYIWTAELILEDGSSKWIYGDVAVVR